MTVPFTYLIKCKPINKFYYGVRYAEGTTTSDLWTNYFTSSKVVHSLIEEYGKEEFEFEVRKTFSSHEKAKQWEKNVIIRMKLKDRNDFLNLSVPGENFGFEPGELNISCSEEIKNLIRKYQKEKINNGTHHWKSKEHSDKCSKRMKDYNKEFNKTRNARYGKILVECPHCGKVGGRSGMNVWHFDNCRNLQTSLN